MNAVFEALLPICVLIGLGLFLRQRQIIPADKWEGVEKLCYWLFFPAILAETLIKSDFQGAPLGDLTATLFCSVLTMMVAMLALKPVFARYGNMSSPTYTSVFQVSTRWNPFIALAIILKLFDAPGVTLVAVAMVAMIPLINVENVCVLAAFITKTVPSLSIIGRTILLNPLILGCLIGMGINQLDIPVWAPIMTIVDLLGRAALGASLLCIGAGLQIHHVLRPSRDVWLGTLIKLFVMPVFVWSWSTWFGLSGQVFYTAIIVAAVPAATNGYILARQMGGDAPLYAASIAVQTALSFFSIPLLIYLAQLMMPLS